MLQVAMTVLCGSPGDAHLPSRRRDGLLPGRDSAGPAPPREGRARHASSDLVARSGGTFFRAPCAVPGGGDLAGVRRGVPASRWPTVPDASSLDAAAGLAASSCSPPALSRMPSPVVHAWRVPARRAPADRAVDLPVGVRQHPRQGRPRLQYTATSYATALRASTTPCSPAATFRRARRQGPQQ